MFMEKITKILLRTYVYLTPSFLTINVFHCHFTFLSIDEPILIKYYLNLYFFQVSSVSINVLYLIPYRSPYYIQSSCLPMLVLVATISQTFFFFFDNFNSFEDFLQSVLQSAPTFGLFRCISHFQTGLMDLGDEGATVAINQWYFLANMICQL